MKSGSLFIDAMGVCCSVGHYRGAALAALRARINHFRETAFIDESGNPLIGAALWDYTLWGESRLLTLVAAAVSECRELSPAWRDEETALLLLGSSPQRYEARNLWLHRLLPQSGGAEVSVFHPASSHFAFGKAGMAELVGHAERLLRESDDVSAVVVAGVDSYLTAPAVQAALAEGRLLSTENSDGFIPGEGAAAFVLRLADPLSPGLHVDGHASVHAAANDPLAGADALVVAIREAAARAGCAVADTEFHVSGMSGESRYAKESNLALTRCLERRRTRWDHDFVARSTGETGAACGPLSLAWMADRLGRAHPSGSRALLHLAGDDARRCAVVVRHQT